jgi:hypothetical protein
MASFADSAAGPVAPAFSPIPSGRGGPNINPSTGLSTDYLNHFTDAVMVLEMIGTLPEGLDDLRNWKPKTYAEHFAASRFSNRDAIAAAYGAADPAARRALDRNAELLNAMTMRTLELVLQHVDTPEVQAIARRALERLRPLISRTASIINGTAPEPAGKQGLQDAIDAMFAR